MITEDQLEQLALTWYQDSGWEYRHGPDIAPDGDTPERADYRQVLLPGRLHEALRRLNPDVPDAVLEEALHRVSKLHGPSIIQSNRSFHEVLLDGLPVIVEKNGEKRGDRVRLIDFEHPEQNQFLVVNQYTVQGKPMRDHNLMQAIARVNRVFRDKEGGLVVDYIGIAAELRRALKTYTESRGKGQPTLDSAEALAKLKELLEVARGLLHGFDYAAYRTQATGLLLPAANFVLGLEDGKKRWFDVVLAITKAFSLCGTLDEAMELREEIAFFQAIKSVIAKATETDKKLSEDKKNAVLKQILDNAVVAEGVEDIFKLAGLDRPDIGILSDAFLEEVRNLPQRNFAVELLQKLLNDEIKSRSRTNVILEKKFSDRLMAALNRYRSRAIESAQVIEELIQMAKEFREAAKRGENLGLNESELAFYDALADN